MALTIKCYDAAGKADCLVLALSNDCYPQKHFLPNRLLGEGAGVLLSLDQAPSHPICIEIHASTVLISCHQETHPKSSILTAAGDEFQIPISTQSLTKSIMLRPGDQIITPTARWSIERWSIDSQIQPGPHSIMVPRSISSAGSTELSPITDSDAEASPEKTKAVNANSALTTFGGNVSEVRQSPDTHSDVLLGNPNSNENEMSQTRSNPREPPGATPSPSKTRKRKLSTYSEPVPPRSAVKRKNDEPVETGGEDTIIVASTSVSQPPLRTFRQTRSSSLSYSHGSEDVAEASSALSARFHKTQSDPTSSTDKTSVHPGKIAKRKSLKQNEYEGSQPSAVFSRTTTIATKKLVMENFKFLGGKIVKAVTEANILCVGKGPLKKTAKLIMAVALGIDVVTEEWFVESQRRGMLLKLDLFQPIDTEREKQWRFNLEDAIKRGKGGMTHILGGRNIHFTTYIKEEVGTAYREFSQIATILGADAVKGGLPSGRARIDSTVVIGSQDDPWLSAAGRLGHKVFSKDLLIMAALRGELDIESEEFLLKAPIKGEDLERGY